MSQPINRYLVSVPQPQRRTLEIVRDRIRSLLPTANETIRYGIPTHDLDGVPAIGYAAFTRHCSLFPYSSHVVTVLAHDLADHPLGRGTIQFPVDNPLQLTLLRRIVAVRLQQMSTSWPRTGHARMFYPDGRLKLKGATRDGKAHGSWTWFRKDGSLMRVGEFTNGLASGSWSTFDRTGALVRTGPPPKDVRIA